MSRFYASITNERSTITKCGHNDGLTIHARGWNKGIRIEIYYDKKTNTEKYVVYETAQNIGKRMVLKLSEKNPQSKYYLTSTADTNTKEKETMQNQ